jgi:hypothetical protein
MKQKKAWFLLFSVLCLAALVGLECLDGYLTRQNQMYYNQFYTLLLVRYGTPCLLGVLICLRQIGKQRAGARWALWVDLGTFAACVCECIWWYQSGQYVRGNGGHLLFLALVCVSLIHSVVWRKSAAIE